MPPVDAQVSRVSAEALTKALVEAQVSRVSAEALVKALVESQVSRVSAEALVRSLGQVQVSRVSAEVLRQAVELFSQAQVSRVSVEALTKLLVEAHISRVSVEALTKELIEAHVSRVSVEALTKALVEAQVSRLSVEALIFYEPFLDPVELAGDSSLAADATVVKFAFPDPLAGDSDLDATFTVHTGTIPNLGSSWVLDATASPIYTSGRADLVGEGHLAADATVYIGPVALEGSSSLNASAEIVIAQHRIAADLQGVGQLGADARITSQRLQGDLDGVGGLDAHARIDTTVATSLQGEGGLTASAFISSFKVNLPADSDLRAEVVAERFLGQQRLDGSSDLQGTIQPIDHRVSADLGGTGELAADAYIKIEVVLDGDSSLSATAGVTTFTSAALAGDSDLYGDGTLNTWYGRASLSGVADLDVRITTVTQWAAADLAGLGSLRVEDVFVHIDQDLLLAGEGFLSATIIKVIPAGSRLRSNAGFSVQAHVSSGDLRIESDLRGESELDVTVRVSPARPRGAEVVPVAEDLLLQPRAGKDSTLQVSVIAHAMVRVEIMDVRMASLAEEPFDVRVGSDEIVVDGTVREACSLVLSAVERVALAVDVLDKTATDIDIHEAI